jgi:CheY-like chemotaxis protein
VKGPIVVIEDEIGVRELLRDLLEMEGFSVLDTGDPARVEHIDFNLPPRLFLIDVMLPGMSGIELAERLRRSDFPSTPMIAMSASWVMVRAAAESGLFQEALEKPFDVGRLLECIERNVSQSAYLPAGDESPAIGFAV